MRCFLGVLAIAVATLLPRAAAALPTDILGSPVLQMSEADKKLQYDAALEVLNSSDAKAMREWQNPKTGFTGRIEARGDMTSSDGLSCRRLQLSSQVRGLQSSFTFPFCKDAEGKWFIASGMKFSDDNGATSR